MRLRIATWNINSVRLRAGLVERFLAEEVPDILCLQETKCPVDRFPCARFEGCGYRYIVVRGQPMYNGVAVIARIPVEDAGEVDYCDRGDARHVAVRLANGLVIENLYVPAGGDVPDPEANPKFAHKLAFLEEMGARLGAGGRPLTVLVGDFNVAPLESDVWSHRQLRNVVSHTEPEIMRLNRVQESGQWTDIVRLMIPEPQKLYSWWSYRARDWQRSDRGRRLDHIWISPDLRAATRTARICKHVRGWDRGSDHAPVVAELDL